MTKTWIQKRKKDQYYRLAKIRGYRSRAAYKLLQTSRTYNLIQQGQRVLDLGSQPGGWMQVAREIVGPEGIVVGVDIKKMDKLGYPNMKILNMDIYSENIVREILHELGGPADVVLSDLAPSIIGAWEVDHSRQVGLARRALEIAERVLDHNGNVLIKLFHGPELKKVEQEAKPLFNMSRLLKPKASRPESSEIYFLGLGFKGKWTGSQEMDQELSPIILVTGPPGSGKTTLLRRIVEHLEARRLVLRGIISDEVREHDHRIGFKIRDLATGQEAWLAKRNGDENGIRIGGYVVQHEDFEKVGIKALESAIVDDSDLIVIDEVGPMEMTSSRFRENLEKIIDNEKVPVLVTVRQGSNYPEIGKIGSRAKWFEISRENRDETYEKLMTHLDKILHVSKGET